MNPQRRTRYGTENAPVPSAVALTPPNEPLRHPSSGGSAGTASAWHTPTVVPGVQPVPVTVTRSATRRALIGSRHAGVLGALGRYEARLNEIERRGIALADVTFAADFGRNLEYYTGFVFEILSPLLREQEPLAGGGRYDRLVEAMIARRARRAIHPAREIVQRLRDDADNTRVTRETVAQWPDALKTRIARYGRFKRWM